MLIRSHTWKFSSSVIKKKGQTDLHASVISCVIVANRCQINGLGENTWFIFIKIIKGCCFFLLWGKHSGRALTSGLCPPLGRRLLWSFIMGSNEEQASSGLRRRGSECAAWAGARRQTKAGLRLGTTWEWVMERRYEGLSFLCGHGSGVLL